MTEVSVQQLMSMIGELHVQVALLREENERLRRALMDIQKAGDAQRISEGAKAAADESNIR